MPPPGKALDKPGVNALYKAEVRKLAQQYAAKDEDDSVPAVVKEIRHLVNSPALTGDRRADAHRAVTEAIKKIDQGVSPLTGLSPPPDCGPCAGRSSKTHHFLCASRARQPALQEQTVREQIKRKLVEIYRAKQLAVRRAALAPARLPTLAGLEARYEARYE